MEKTLGIDRSWVQPSFYSETVDRWFAKRHSTASGSNGRVVLFTTCSVNYNDPKPGSYGAIAVDAKERIYLAGRIGKHAGKSKKGPQRTNFLLARTTPKGAPDRSFGHEATVTTDFGARANTFATQIAIDGKGRILVGGGIQSPQLETGGGFAIARYLP